MADAFKAFERSIEASRQLAFDLGSALQRAREAGGISPVLSRRLFAALTASQGGLDTTLTHCSEAHRRAASFADELGIPPTAYGDQTPPEQPEKRGGVFTGA